MRSVHSLGNCLASNPEAGRESCTDPMPAPWCWRQSHWTTIRTTGIHGASAGADDPAARQRQRRNVLVLGFTCRSVKFVSRPLYPREASALSAGLYLCRGSFSYSRRE